MVVECKLNFHPDEDFSNYVCVKDGSPTFSMEEFIEYNKLMKEAFRVCKENGIDICDMGVATFLGEEDKIIS